ncbi:MAG: Hsp20/alpha crystallin family protein [Syntrophales bacterium]|nr:Hsp20/alpha crystallin family protein [Syntrophales bacterium]
MEREAQVVKEQEFRTPEEGARTRNKRVFIPRVDIYESKDSIVLLADMPGVDVDDVDVTLEKNTLTIRGSVKPMSFEGLDLVYSEYDAGDYQRSFSVPEDVDRERIEATVKNGVLRLVLPKSEAAKAKKIAIKVEN